ncbi:phosphate transport system protein [Thermosyntropha lipolytica DSM 11003]|uniref:Phosphate-specific transport system accessory protein PhoU n=1 Tax=Thermosyntropha lipolytica DSM 11003 TaxID=1123382 RepID=A0A1M5K6N2_9FIRM|nr:phosphate signaling complex protein PhoU [Thermosyntropha lipolytica]SHG48468.1 phosphate transport system protein [Thermosyntropha lipolytica DSM 11003]
MVNDSLHSELGRLKEEILKMGRLLEEQVYKSVKSLVEKDVVLAREVIANDDVIDEMEFAIEKKTLGLIALKQPMAKDLRLIATILRMIIDMERMADHAEDIARITIELYEQPYIKRLIDIPRMAEIGKEMISIALDAFIYENMDKAMSLIPMEEQMDALYEQIFRELLSYMMQDPRTIAQATELLLVAGHLERIGDHATNIGEMVIYVVEGRRVDFNELARKKEDNK